jgi:hypothetical protein
VGGAYRPPLVNGQVDVVLTHILNMPEPQFSAWRRQVDGHGVRRGQPQVRAIGIMESECLENATARRLRVTPNRNAYRTIGMRPPWACRTSLLRTVNTRLRDVSAKLGVANPVALAAVVDHSIE